MTETVVQPVTRNGSTRQDLSQTELGILKQSFDEDGYFVVRNVVSRAKLVDLHAKVVHEFERSKRWKDFIKRYIFPGGCLPSISAMVESTSRVTDMRLVDLRDISKHYSITLRHWRAALDRRFDDARALGMTERFLRMWRFYFAYCEAGFAEQRVSDVQVVFARPRWDEVAA